MRTKDFLNIQFPGKWTFFGKLKFTGHFVYNEKVNLELASSLTHNCKSY